LRHKNNIVDKYNFSGQYERSRTIWSYDNGSDCVMYCEFRFHALEPHLE